MDKNSIIATASILTVLAVGVMTIGESYTQYYPAGEAYVSENKTYNGEVKYLNLTENEYKNDPINKNPKVYEQSLKTYYPQRAAKIMLWNEDPLSTVGKWLPEGSYVHLGTETKSEDDDIYFVCHSESNCAGNGNLDIYRVNEEGIPKLTAMLESRLPSLVKTAYAAVAHDNTTSSTFQAAVSSYSFSHTHPTGSNTMLTVCSGNNAADASRFVTGVTYNSNALDLMARGNETSQSDTTAEQWFQVSPSTGANTVAVTWAGTNIRGNIFATSYTGVDTTAPIVNTTSNSALNTIQYSLSLTASTTDHLISDCRVMGSGGANTFTVDSPSTSRGNESGATINHGLANLEATTTVTYMSWTCAGALCGNRDWGGTMVAIRAAAGGVVQAFTSGSVID